MSCAMAWKENRGLNPKWRHLGKQGDSRAIFCSLISSGRRKEETIMITILIIIIVTTKTTQCSPSRCPVTTKCRPSFWSPAPTLCWVKKLNIELKLNDASLWFLAAMCHSASNLPVTLLSDWSLSQLTQRGRIASNGKPALFLQVSTASSNLHFSQTVQTCGQLKPYRWAERNISGPR